MLGYTGLILQLYYSYTGVIVEILHTIPKDSICIRKTAAMIGVTLICSISRRPLWRDTVPCFPSLAMGHSLRDLPLRLGADSPIFLKGLQKRVVSS